MTTCGLSNVSNQVPDENRSLLNRVYLVMLMAVGIDTAIADPLDEELMDVIRIVDERDDSTAAGSLLLTLYDRTAGHGGTGAVGCGHVRARAGGDLEDPSGSDEQDHLHRQLPAVEASHHPREAWGEEYLRWNVRCRR